MTQVWYSFTDSSDIVPQSTVCTQQPAILEYMCSESKSSSPSHWKINRKVQIGLGDHNDFVHLMNFGMMESVTFRITNPNLWHFNRTLWHLCFYMPWVAVKMGQPKAALLKKGTKSHTKHTADEMPHGHHPEDRMKKGKKPPFSHI